MELIENNTDKTKEIVNTNDNSLSSKTIENLNYLYPNGHRITHQMRWFKGSRDRGLKSDIAA
tara:strand:- start:220 stop:405 length:186 start_codon:yes stop_codon:yes gene_type:complete